jgi:predicted nuclease of predicted toxin-antitoxin system
VKFLVDNQLPASLVHFLVERGFHAEHVLDLKMDEADDRAIWQYASVNQLTVISKDEDFTYLATLPNATTQLVWVRLGNCRNADLFEAFATVLPQLEAALKEGASVMEIY